MKVFALAAALFLPTLAAPAANTTSATSKFLAALGTSPDPARGPTEAAISDLNVTSAAMEAAITDLMLGKTKFGATPMGGSVKKIEDLIVKTIEAERGKQRTPLVALSIVIPLWCLQRVYC